MFERFRAHFRLQPVGQSPASPWVDDRLADAAGYEQLTAAFAGCSFENGLYRVHSASSGRTGQANAELAFPSFVGRLQVFAFDWLGRQYALDFGRIEEGEPLVMMLEPGTGEALEIPASFMSFHEEELVDFRDAALADEFFVAWSAANPDAVPLGFSDCAGYRVPLFLGGSDEVANLEATDMDVYWTTVGQMRKAAEGRARGTRISGVTIEE